MLKLYVILFNSKSTMSVNLPFKAVQIVSLGRLSFLETLNRVDVPMYHSKVLNSNAGAGRAAGWSTSLTMTPPTSQTLGPSSSPPSPPQVEPLW